MQQIEAKEKKVVVKKADVIVSNTPQDMIRLAISQGADLEKLGQILKLQEQWEANEARKAYHVAMTAFKANPPKIKKDKKVSFGQTKYSHASLANVTESINGELSKHGLSASWTTKQNGVIEVTCRITHVKGHSEETTLSAPADNSGSKNPIQAIGSAISYLQRYSLLCLAGLATADMDDDGKATVTEFINDKEVSQLLDLIADKEISIDKFCKYMNVEDLNKMPKSDYKKALSAIENKKKVAK